LGLTSIDALPPNSQVTNPLGLCHSAVWGAKYQQTAVTPREKPQGAGEKAGVAVCCSVL